MQTTSRFEEYVLEDPKRQLDSFVDEWRAFAARQEGCSYFQTPDWVLTWWRHQGHPRTVVASWRDVHGALEAVAFLSEVRERVHRRVPLTASMLVNAGSGSPYVADRCGWPMIATRASDVREWAATYRPTMPLVLRNLDRRLAGDCVPDAARQVLRTCAPVLDLTDEPERRQATNLSKQIPRFRRRLEGMGVSFRWVPPGDVSSRDVDALFDLHESRYGLKQGSTFNREVHLEFHRSLVELADGDGGPAMAVAERDGQPVAMQYGFVWQRTFYQYQSGWLAEYATHRLGTVVAAEAIRLARDNGMHSFDFLRGGEPHKYRFGAVDVDDETWLLPRGLSGQSLRVGFGLTRFNEWRKQRRDGRDETVRMDEITTAAGLSFRARIAGPDDGPVVILLHGFPQTSRCWVRQLDALAEHGYRAIAFDQRGYSPGARPPDVEAYKPAELVRDTLLVADALGAEQFDLVGHDFGGMVAWMVAGHHPERVRTLTVASTPHPAAFRTSYKNTTSDQGDRSEYMRTFRGGERGTLEASLLQDDAAVLRTMYAGLDADAIEEYVRVFSEPGALVAAFDWYRSMSGKASAATPAASMPTLYVWSDQDPSLGRDTADASAGFVAGPYRFEVLAGVGHWIPELASDAFTPLLLEHLAS